MHPIPKANVRRLERYLEELTAKRPKLHHEIDVSRLAGLMNSVGFEGPEWRGGSIAGFSHELLKSSSFLTDGRFSVHITHAGKSHKIRYRDLEKYVLPHIEQVLLMLREEGLIREEDDHV